MRPDRRGARPPGRRRRGCTRRSRQERFTGLSTQRILAWEAESERRLAARGPRRRRPRGDPGPEGVLAEYASTLGAGPTCGRARRLAGRRPGEGGPAAEPGGRHGAQRAGARGAMARGLAAARSPLAPGAGRDGSREQLDPSARATSPPRWRWRRWGTRTSGRCSASGSGSRRRSASWPGTRWAVQPAGRGVVARSSRCCGTALGDLDADRVRCGWTTSCTRSCWWTGGARGTGSARTRRCSRNWSRCGSR